MTMTQRYIVLPKDSVHTLRVVQDMDLEGHFYPNTKTEFFILHMTEEQAILLKLRTPCRAVADD